MTNAGTILWFRQDLRIADNPALVAAVRRGGPVTPVYIGTPDEEGAWPPGAASRWWLHQSLAALDAALRARGNRLILRRGPSLETIRAMGRETGCRAICWNRRYEPAAVARDAAVARALKDEGWDVVISNGSLLVEPEGVLTGQGRPYQVFTPFWKAVRDRDVGETLSAPDIIPAPRPLPASAALAALALEPTVDWAEGLRETWTPGPDGANAALRLFLEEAVADYPEKRDIPGERGTARLSPHLHFGEISPRAVLHAIQQHAALDSAPGVLRGAEAVLRQLYWREFAHYLLYHFPHTPERPLRPEFARFPWRKDPAALRAWQRGRTGYPLVDAGMRELRRTGWMHNRVRMAAASFLVKHLLISWLEGARWFWDTLVDADLANNTFGWQWTAGCGADAAPYFRIFNPVLQGRRFDPDGAYVRKWLPELAGLPQRFLHEPWSAPPDQRAAAYPPPIVEHAAARHRALEAYAAMRTL